MESKAFIDDRVDLTNQLMPKANLQALKILLRFIVQTTPFCFMLIKCFISMLVLPFRSH